MSDDKMNRGEPDRSRINLNEDYEVIGPVWYHQGTAQEGSREGRQLTGRYRAARRQARVSCNRLAL